MCKLKKRGGYVFNEVCMSLPSLFTNRLLLLSSNSSSGTVPINNPIAIFFLFMLSFHNAKLNPPTIFPQILPLVQVRELTLLVIFLINYFATNRCYSQTTTYILSEKHSFKLIPWWAQGFQVLPDYFTHQYTPWHLWSLLYV